MNLLRIKILFTLLVLLVINVGFQAPKSSSVLIESWNQFKRALKYKDVDRTASFFEFPFYTDDNQIWLLAKNFPKEDDSFLGEGPIPFNLLDLRENYDGVFPQQFRDFVNQVNGFELAKLDTVHLAPMLNGDTVYNFKASLAINAHQVQLFYERSYPGGGQEVVYELNMSPDEHLKIMSIQIAE